MTNEHQEQLWALAQRFRAIADAFERADVSAAQVLLMLTEVELKAIGGDVDEDDEPAVEPGRN